MSHQGNLQGFQKIFAAFTSDQCKSIKSQIENEIKIAEGVGSLKTMVVLDDISQSSAENTRYGNTGYGVSRPGLQNQKDFCIRINIPKEYY